MSSKQESEIEIEVLEAQVKAAAAEVETLRLAREKTQRAAEEARLVSAKASQDEMDAFDCYMNAMNAHQTLSNLLFEEKMKRIKRARPDRPVGTKTQGGPDDWS